MSDLICIGVDPGVGGGLAAIFPDDSVSVIPMPETVRDVWEWIKDYRPDYSAYLEKWKSVSYLEKVWGHIGENQPGSAMFAFGASYGRLQMALTAACIPYEEVVPKRWQKLVGITPRLKSESRGQWKARLKDFAQKMFPSTHITLKTADALLIAEACRRSKK